MDYDIIDSVSIRILVINESTDSVKISILTDSDTVDSTTIGIIPFNLVGVTAPCGHTYNTPTNPIIIDPSNPAPTTMPIPGEVSETIVDNPFYPTIIIGGITLVYNASTYPV